MIIDPNQTVTLNQTCSQAARCSDAVVQPYWNVLESASNVHNSIIILKLYPLRADVLTLIV